MDGAEAMPRGRASERTRTSTSRPQSRSRSRRRDEISVIRPRDVDNAVGFEPLTRDTILAQITLVAESLLHPPVEDDAAQDEQAAPKMQAMGQDADDGNEMGVWDLPQDLKDQANVSAVALMDSQPLAAFQETLEWDVARGRTGERTYVVAPAAVIRPPGRILLEPTRAAQRRVVQLVSAGRRRGLRLPMLERTVGTNTAVIRAWSVLDVEGIQMGDDAAVQIPDDRLPGLLPVDTHDIALVATEAIVAAQVLPNDQTAFLRALIAMHGTLQTLLVVTHENAPSQTPIAEIYRVVVRRTTWDAAHAWQREIEAGLGNADAAVVADALEAARTLRTKPAEEPVYLSLVAAGRVPDAHAPQREFLVVERVSDAELAALKRQRDGFYEPGLVTTLTPFDDTVTRTESFVLGPRLQTPAELVALVTGADVDGAVPARIPEPARTLGLWESEALVPALSMRQRDYTTVVEGPPRWADGVVAFLGEHVVATLSLAPSTRWTTLHASHTHAALSLQTHTSGMATGSGRRLRSSPGRGCLLLGRQVRSLSSRDRRQHPLRPARNGTGGNPAARGGCRRCVRCGTCLG